MDTNKVAVAVARPPFVFILAFLLTFAAGVITLSGMPDDAYAAQQGTVMHRLYNPNSGEHFYTASATEKNSLAAAGWKYEGIGWYAPASGNDVYRLYNPNAGDHHYTTSASERDQLTGAGWRFEGIGWHSDRQQRVALYRQYNPFARSGSHNYTTSKAENDSLVATGWRAEGVGWYGIPESVAKGSTGSAPAPAPAPTQPSMPEPDPEDPFYVIGDPDDSVSYPDDGKPNGANNESNTFKVIFEPNGGEGTMKDQSIEEGCMITFPECEFSREGYTFIGWCLNAEGESDCYCPGVGIYSKAKKGETVKVYAMWEADSSQTSGTPSPNDPVTDPEPTPPVADPEPTPTPTTPVADPTPTTPVVDPEPTTPTTPTTPATDPTPTPQPEPVKNGLITENGKTYLYNNGKKTYGWYCQNSARNEWRYFDMKTGEMYKNREVYLDWNVDGVTGDAGWRCFDSNGLLVHGWQGARYYYPANGVRAQGEVWIDRTDGITDTDGVRFFSEDGVLQHGWQYVNGAWKYFEWSKGLRVENCQYWIDGYAYHFDGYGVRLTDWVGDGYYYNADNGRGQPYERAVFDAYNAYRVSCGLNAVAWDDNCANMAWQSAYLNNGGVQHRLGIPTELQNSYSDILQVTRGYVRKPAEVIARWAQSDGHRRMMKCPTTQIAGVGFYYENGVMTYAIVYNFDGCNQMKNG